MNPNRNPNNPNALCPSTFQPISPLFVSFLGFFRGEAPPLFPTRYPPGARAGKDPPAPERFSRYNPHNGPLILRNPLRLGPMPLLGFQADPPFPLSESPNIVGIILTVHSRGGIIRTPARGREPPASRIPEVT